MQAILMLTIVLVIVLLVALFVYDAKRSRGGEQEPAEEEPDAPPRGSPTPPPAPPAEDPSPAPGRESARSPVDAEALATHVRKLRRAVDAELVSRDEAVESILRQSGDRLSPEAATRLLDGGPDDPLAPEVGHVPDDVEPSDEPRFPDAAGEGADGLVPGGDVPDTPDELLGEPPSREPDPDPRELDPDAGESEAGESEAGENEAGDEGEGGADGGEPSRE
ncbi:hypothetical protein ER308_20695 [Egibacter rhizosphaerae]|uniref:Uncharacterized protein n=1 Tax=Egibacter rhizosphaerae TaxID=1670831 RepID=A0A411YKM1_9ACTN|nr:hypothetical protein [Egibacter rhizosphaerae]QBI21736.1 hypothetical protein ER308_20695 [Egibacter rhizosphaerae]